MIAVNSNQYKTMRDVLKRSKQERLNAFKGFKVQHPLLLKAYDELWRAIKASHPGSIIIIFGPTGVGKTTLLEGISKRLIKMRLAELKNNPELMPVITVQLDAPTTGNFDWKDYFKRLLIEMDEPLVDHKIDMGRWNPSSPSYFSENPRNRQVIFSDKSSTSILRFACEQTLRRRNPLIVLLDEAQHLGIISSGRKLLDQLNTIKSIADKSLTTHGLCGTYELIPFRNLSGQLSRRSIDVHFGRYQAQNKAHREAFINVLFTFQHRLPLSETPDFISKWDYFYERCIGCIGVLKDWLTVALTSALEEDSRTLTLERLEQHAPSVTRCNSMLREAVDGEKEIEESMEARTKLRNTLGLEPLSLRTKQQPSLLRGTEQSSKTGKKGSKRRVGLRNPVRDEIGKKTA